MRVILFSKAECAAIHLQPMSSCCSVIMPRPPRFIDPKKQFLEAEETAEPDRTNVCYRLFQFLPITRSITRSLQKGYLTLTDRCLTGRSSRCLTGIKAV